MFLTKEENEVSETSERNDQMRKVWKTPVIIVSEARDAKQNSGVAADGGAGSS